MTLPPWRSDDPAEQAAFLRWAIGELDSDDDRRATAGNNTASIGLLLDMVATGEAARREERRQFDEASRFMPRLTMPEFRRFRAEEEPSTPSPAPRPGPKPMDPLAKRSRTVEMAAADNARLTALFQMHYGRKKRTAYPTREQIICERWALTASEWQQVKNMIELPKRKRTLHDV